jgi:chromosome segregation ATPase
MPERIATLQDDHSQECDQFRIDVASWEAANAELTKRTVELEIELAKAKSRVQTLSSSIRATKTEFSVKLDAESMTSRAKKVKAAKEDMKKKSSSSCESTVLDFKGQLKGARAEVISLRKALKSWERKLTALKRKAERAGYDGDDASHFLTLTQIAVKQQGTKIRRLEGKMDTRSSSSSSRARSVTPSCSSTQSS